MRAFGLLRTAFVHVAELYILQIALCGPFNCEKTTFFTYAQRMQIRRVVSSVGSQLEHERRIAEPNGWERERI